jgi:hypothetical protein
LPLFIFAATFVSKFCLVFSFAISKADQPTSFLSFIFAPIFQLPPALLFRTFALTTVDASPIFFSYCFKGIFA